jgi:hypothetical protein
MGDAASDSRAKIKSEKAWAEAEVGSVLINRRTCLMGRMGYLG